MNLDADITADELKVFLEEAEEQIELLDEDIIRLEKEGEDQELLQEIFRAAHTLKGSSAMLGHQRMAELTHAMENLLDKLRNGTLLVSTEIIDTLLYSLDALKVLKEEITSSEDSDLDIVPIVAKLKEVTEEEISQAPVKETVLTVDQRTKEDMQAALAKGQSVYRIKIAIDRESEWVAVRCLQIMNDLARIGEILASAPSAEEIEEEKVGHNLELILASSEDKDTLQGVIVSIAEVDNVDIAPCDPEDSTASVEKLVPAGQRKTDQGPDSTSKSQEETKKLTSQESSQTLQSVRIDVQVLDNLMNIVEQLVIDRSRISRVGKMLQARYTDDELISELGETSDHIIQVINQLQENIMKVRMVPIGIVFSRFPRLVRDLAQAQKKKLDFIIEGEETELDRSIIEQIRDPLIHLLRNAVDHGIESSEKRNAASKPETALIRLAAYHEQSHIVISVEDDGKGIDVNRIKDSALRKGLISAEEAESLSVSEVINLIFMAGMSTAEKATEVSGRGVGLDIVRTNVENLNGSISLDSKVGQGSKFTIRLPLTVAIIQGLLISSADVLYVMPLVSLVETLMVEPWEVQTIRGKEIIRLRDEILPVLRLNVVLGGGVRSTENKAKDLVVVVRASDKLVGIVVDALMERQEIVVKSLGEYLGDIEGIAGATILGDGKVALILDVASLTKMTIQGSADNKKREMRAVDTLHLTAS